MKKTRIPWTLIAFAVIASAQPVMTNQTVEAMLRGGVAVPTIITAIKTAAYIQLFMSKEFYDRLLNAGASPSVADQVVQAMHERTYKGAVRAEDVRPVPAAVALARMPAVTTPVAQLVETPAPAVAPPPPAVVAAPALIAPVHHAMTLEDGTPVRLRISHNLSSADATTNETVDFEVLEEVKVGDQIVIPKGSIAWGTVTDAEAKRRMGRAGKLNVTIDAVRLADGEKAALRGIKDVKGGGHVGAMTTGIVLTSLVVWPAAPLFLLMHGKDVTIPKGTEITAYTNGNMTLSGEKFARASASSVADSSPQGLAGEAIAEQARALPMATASVEGTPAQQFPSAKTKEGAPSAPAQGPPTTSGALESLPHGFYYQASHEWKKLDNDSSSGFHTTHGASSLVGVPPGVVRSFDGSEASIQFDNGQPVFGIRVDASRADAPGFTVRDLLIVRMTKKKDHREVEVMEGGFASERIGLNSKDVAAVTLTTLADRSFVLVPKNELPRGEYMITFRGANGTAGYDFGIK